MRAALLILAILSHKAVLAQLFVETPTRLGEGVEITGWTTTECPLPALLASTILQTLNEKGMKAEAVPDASKATGPSIRTTIIEAKTQAHFRRIVVLDVALFDKGKEVAGIDFRRTTATATPDPCHMYERIGRIFAVDIQRWVGRKLKPAAEADDGKPTQD